MILSITALSIKGLFATFSMTLNIMTFSITTLLYSAECH
jgi:hypothetical protein